MKQNVGASVLKTDQYRGGHGLYVCKLHLKMQEFFFWIPYLIFSSIKTHVKSIMSLSALTKRNTINKKWVLIMGNLNQSAVAP